MDFDPKKIASRFELMAVTERGEEAVKQLLTYDRQDQLAIVKQLRKDAKDEGAKVYITDGRLHYESPMNVVRLGFALC